MSGQEKAGRCWLFHQWTKWTPVQMGVMTAWRGHAPVHGTQLYQERVCIRCGFLEQRRV